MKLRLILLVAIVLFKSDLLLAQEENIMKRSENKLHEFLAFQKEGNDSAYVRGAIELYETSLDWPTKYSSPTVMRYYCNMISDIGLNDVAISEMTNYLDANSKDVSLTDNRKLHQQLALYYLRAEKFEMSKQTYLKSTHYNGDEAPGNLSYSVANNIGYVCLKMNDLDSALYYFDYAWKSKTEWPDNRLKFKISLIYNIAQTYESKGDYVLAREYYNLGLNEIPEDFASENELIAQGKMGIINCDLEENNAGGVEQRLDSVYVLLPTLKDPLKDKFLPKFYQLKRKYFLLIGNLYEASKAEINWLEFENKELLIKEENIRIVLSELSRIANQKAEENIEEKATQLSLSRDKINILSSRNTILWFAIISFILLGGLTIFYLVKYYKKKKLQVKTMEELVEKTTSLLETEKQLKDAVESEMAMKLQLKEKDVSNLALEINRKKQWMEELTKRLSGVKKEDKLSELQKWMREGSYLDKNQAYFLEKVEEVNEEFFHHLKERFPKLTPKEVELCGLLKLNLSLKDIAIHKQISPESVKTARKRLRRKLGIEPGGDVYGFIQNLT